MIPANEAHMAHILKNFNKNPALATYLQGMSLGKYLKPAEPKPV